MSSFLRIARLDFLPRSADLALLVLRLWIGCSMLALHGWGKLMSFPEKAATFQDPLGIGSHASMALAIIGEMVCSLLLIAGFLGRLGALGGAATMAVAFFFYHKAALSGAMSGELAFIYLAAYVALLIAGPGRFSIDAQLDGRRRSGAE